MNAAKILSDEFSRRKERNKSYSIRAFARDLQMSPGAASDLLKGKRKLTPRTLARLAKATGLPLQVYTSALETAATRAADHRMDIKQFELISGWEHFAILNLTSVVEFKSDLRWISRRLNLPTTRVKKAIGRLKDLGLLAEDAGGHLSRIVQRISIPTTISAPALRAAHLEELEQIKHAITHTAVEKRDVTSLTVPVNLAKLSEAKKMIWDFHKKLSDCLEDGECSEVYTAVFALYPVTT